MRCVAHGLTAPWAIEGLRNKLARQNAPGGYRAENNGGKEYRHFRILIDEKACPEYDQYCTQVRKV